MPEVPASGATYTITADGDLVRTYHASCWRCLGQIGLSLFVTADAVFLGWLFVIYPLVLAIRRSEGLSGFLALVRSEPLMLPLSTLWILFCGLVAVSWIVELVNVLRTWTFEVNVSSNFLELRSIMRRTRLILTDLRSLELNKDGSLRLSHTRGALYARTVPQVEELLAILTAANPAIQVRRE